MRYIDVLNFNLAAVPNIFYISLTILFEIYWCVGHHVWEQFHPHISTTSCSIYCCVGLEVAKWCTDNVAVSWERVVIQSESTWLQVHQCSHTLRYTHNTLNLITAPWVQTNSTDFTIFTGEHKEEYHKVSFCLFYQSISTSDIEMRVDIVL